MVGYLDGVRVLGLVIIPGAYCTKLARESADEYGLLCTYLNIFRETSESTAISDLSVTAT